MKLFFKSAFFLALIFSSSYSFSTIVKIFNKAQASEEDFKELSSNAGLSGDFLVFYTAARIYSDNSRNLYIAEKQKRGVEEASLLESVNTSKAYLYMYPPQIAAVLKPLLRFSYQNSYFCFVVSAVAFSSFGLLLILKTINKNFLEKFLLFFFSFSYAPLTVFCFFRGQLSFIAIFLLSLVFFLLSRRNFFSSGLVSSLLLYKPPLFLYLLLFLFFRENSFFKKGFFLGVTVLLGHSLYLIGFSGVVDYLNLSTRYLYGQSQDPSLTLASSLLSYGLNNLMYTVSKNSLVTKSVLFLTFLALLVFQLRLDKKLSLDFKPINFSLAIVISYFLSLQALDYDCAVLSVVFLIIYSRAHLISNDRKLFLAILSFFFVNAWLLRSYNIYYTTIFSWFLITILIIYLFYVLQKSTTTHYSSGRF